MELVPDITPFFLDKNYRPIRLANQYLQTLKRRSSKTMRAYSHVLLKWLTHCEERGLYWQAVRLDDVLQYRDDMKVSNQTKNYHFERLRQFYRWCRPFGVFYPFKGIDEEPRLGHIPVQQSEVRLVSLIDVGRFCAALSERDALIAKMIVHSGMRRSEVLTVTRIALVERPDHTGMVPLTVRGKGGKERTVRIPVFVQAKLVEWAAKQPPSPWLFHRRGKPLCPDTIGAAFRKARLATGVPVHPHLLRHIFATQMLSKLERRGKGGKGMDAALKLVQIALGHSQLSTTARYLHLMNPDMDAECMGDLARHIADEVRKGGAA